MLKTYTVMTKTGWLVDVCYSLQDAKDMVAVLRKVNKDSEFMIIEN